MLSELRLFAVFICNRGLSWNENYITGSFSSHSAVLCDEQSGDKEMLPIIQIVNVHCIARFADSVSGFHFKPDILKHKMVKRLLNKKL
jgi:hypothetical protein